MQKKLGAPSAVLDVCTAKPRLQYLARSTYAEVIQLAPDGTPLLGAHTAAIALTLLGPQSLHRLRAKPGEPMTFEGHHQREAAGVARCLVHCRSSS